MAAALDVVPVLLGTAPLQACQRGQAYSALDCLPLLLQSGW